MFLRAPAAGQAAMDSRPGWLLTQRHVFSTVAADEHLFDRLDDLPRATDERADVWHRNIVAAWHQDPHSP
jgi:ABC-type siderophore export system fused ATPase/permease subunit